MMTQLFVKVKTSDYDDYYIVPYDEAARAFENELENNLAMEGSGVIATFEITEMSEKEYMSLPKYEGPVNRGGHDWPTDRTTAPEVESIAILENIASEYGRTPSQLIRDIADYKVLMVWPGESEVNLFTCLKTDPFQVARQIKRYMPDFALVSRKDVNKA